MAVARQWTLTDTAAHLWVEDFHVDAAACGMHGAWSVTKRTLRGGLSDGVDLIEVDNGELSFSVLPTRGMGIWKGVYRGLPLGWASPVRGPVHPRLVDLQDRGGLGFLTGFDEMIVRCGLDSMGAPGPDVVPNNMGVPTQVDMTLHGRIANLPASHVEVELADGDPPELVVSGTVYETGLFYPGFRLVSRVSTPLGANCLNIVDQVTNLRGVNAAMELLYHCNFGSPFLEAGARLNTAARLVAPRDARAVEDIDTYDTYLGPTPGYVEQAYWYRLLGDVAGRTVAMLSNAVGDRGVALRFKLDELPAFAQWKNTAATSDGYVTGLEPATDYPNPKAFERDKGRLLQMAPGGVHTTHLGLEVHDDRAGVAGVEAEITRLQQQVERQVHRQPLAEFSPGA